MKKICLFVSIIFLSTFHLAHGKVMLGIEVLESEQCLSLKGKRIGLITNSTGRNSRGVRTIDILHRSPNVQLVALFTPEHGLSGLVEHGKNIGDSQDAKTGLPVYSLYGKTQRPTAAMLAGLDALVFDIQDIGARFYTYVTTLAYALEEASKHNLEFIVLDRPNPINGEIVEGEILDLGINHFTAYLHVPMRHGMTAGEIAQWHNATAKLNAKLTVIKMQGWQRSMWWDQTGLKFRATSPNIRTLEAASLYPGIGAFEATNVAVGRGTGTPFARIGAPWINSDELLERLNFNYLDGFEFEKTSFKPKADIYKGKLCHGVKIKLKDRENARPINLFIDLMFILNDLYPKTFAPRWEEVKLVTGSDLLKEKMLAKQSAQEVNVIFRDHAEQFKTERKPYLLYE